MPARVSVIVVNYNGRDFLPLLFDSLRAQTLPPAEIVLVDNASTDGSVALVRERFPEVRVIDSGGNLGFAVGNNLGAAATDGEYLALINSDAYVEPRWCETLAAVLDARPDAAVAVGKIYYTGTDRVFDQAGAVFNNVGNYWGRGHLQRDEKQFDEPCEVAGLTACAMMLRRAALGGEELFDRDFFMYGEELDLTIRLRGAGHTIRYEPAAIAWHAGMGSLKQAQKDDRLFQQFHANVNRLKVIARRYPRGLLLRSLPVLALAFVYWNAFFLFRGGPRQFLRALSAQTRAIRRGIAQRNDRDREAARRWLPWVTNQTVRDMIAVKRRIHRY
jgi:GT2 family glycosyltransferase